MAQNILCPTCHNTIAYVPQDLGKTLMCPYCSQTFTLAQPSLPNGSTQPHASSYPAYTPQYRRAAPLHRSPRPPGVTILAVVGIVCSSFLIMAGFPILLPVLFVIDPQVAEKLDSHLPKNLEFKYLQMFFGAMLILGAALLINSIAFWKGKKFAKLIFNLIAILVITATTAAVTRQFLNGDIRSHFVILVSNLFCLFFFLTAFIYLQRKSVQSWFH
jgi:hypothetical protein